MASNLLLVMASNLRSGGPQPTSDGLQPKKLQPTSRDGLHYKLMASNLRSDGLQPTTSDGLQPKKWWPPTY